MLWLWSRTPPISPPPRTSHIMCLSLRPSPCHFASFYFLFLFAGCLVELKCLSNYLDVLEAPPPPALAGREKYLTFRINPCKMCLLNLSPTCNDCYPTLKAISFGLSKLVSRKDRVNPCRAYSKYISWDHLLYHFSSDSPLVFGLKCKNNQRDFTLQISKSKFYKVL